jgi:hypothetical protein
MERNFNQQQTRLKMELDTLDAVSTKIKQAQAIAKLISLQFQSDNETQLSYEINSFALLAITGLLDEAHAAMEKA